MRVKAYEHALPRLTRVAELQRLAAADAAVVVCRGGGGDASEREIMGRKCGRESGGGAMKNDEVLSAA